MADIDTIGDIILPILRRTYGTSEMVDRLATHLAEKIADYDPEDTHWKTRESVVRETCWLWFSGGGTAQRVAEQIEEALADG